jgi:hypothetical protein
MKKQHLLLLAIPMLLLTSCGKTYIARSSEGYASFPGNTISPEQAVKLADPYLDKTFELRAAKRQGVSPRKPTVWVTLKGQYYHIVKDNYPAYNRGFYLHHAVKVDKDTGDMIAPE